jgi:hypothetical protein
MLSGSTTEAAGSPGRQHIMLTQHHNIEALADGMRSDAMGEREIRDELRPAGQLPRVLDAVIYGVDLTGAPGRPGAENTQMPASRS